MYPVLGFRALICRHHLRNKQQHWAIKWLTSVKVFILPLCTKSHHHYHVLMSDWRSSKGIILCRRRIKSLTKHLFLFERTQSVRQKQRKLINIIEIAIIFGWSFRFCQGSKHKKHKKVWLCWASLVAYPLDHIKYKNTANTDWSSIDWL